MNPLEKQKLNQRLAMPFEDKLLLTRRRIKEWYEFWDGDVYLAFSGGKDSTVLKHIIEAMYRDVPSVTSNTGLEMPEIMRFAMRQPNVERVVPKKDFRRVITEDGFALVSKTKAKMIRVLKEGDTGRNSNMFKLYDTGVSRSGGFNKNSKLPQKWRYLVDADIKISDACCDHLKKEPLDTYAKRTGRKPYTAMMVSEGGARARLTQCNAFDAKHPKSNPMLFWTEDDVWEYINTFNVEICEVYYDRLVDAEGKTVATSKDPVAYAQHLQGLVPVARMGDIVRYVDKNGNRTHRVPAEKRTGCMFCMFGVEMEKGANRFQRMAVTHPRHWDTCINKLGLSKPLDLINVKYIPEDDDDEL